MKSGNTSWPNHKVVAISTRSVLQRLDQEITLLKRAMAKIDPNSHNPEDRWAIPIYEKIIRRRERLIELMGAT